MRIAFIGATILVTLVLASARSENKVQSLADYIAAICATPLRQPPPEEALYLSETIGAMTKMKRIINTRVAEGDAEDRATHDLLNRAQSASAC